MNSKERVLTAFAHQEPDRVPVNYMSNPGIDMRLKKHFGLKRDDFEGLRCALRVDFHGVSASYVGPKLHADIPECGVKVDDWGMHRRWVEHKTGGYWDYCDFPLKEATEEEVAVWSMPSPDNFDYNQVVPQCKLHRNRAVYIGSAGYGDIINKNGMLRGMEQALVDLITEHTHNE